MPETSRFPVAKRKAPRVTPMCQYTTRQLKFLRAIDQLKRTRPFPTWCEVLDVIDQLGYLPPPGDDE